MTREERTEYNRKYYADHKEKFFNYQRLHADRIAVNKRIFSSKHKELGRKAFALHKQRHPLRVKARNAVSYALQTGKLVRQPCVVCGDNRSQAHHSDYAKPLNVTWLCGKHHKAIGRSLWYFQTSVLLSLSA